jgi:putative heme-binding domain-containing protein
VACHTVSPDEALRGPYLGNIATLYRRKELAEAVLWPDKSIAQGFVGQMIEQTDGQTHVGFITQEAAEAITLRNIVGQEVVVPVSSIKTREKMKNSVMPAGLAAGLTVAEFASLLRYLEVLAEKKP